MHILFVDDAPDSADLYRLAFMMGGHITNTARNGGEAVRVIQEEGCNFDVIIMDYHMPDMTGVEVLEKLKTMDDCRVPVILFTGKVDTQFEQQAMDLGVARVVYKPITPNRLLEIAGEVVTRNSNHVN